MTDDTDVWKIASAADAARARAAAAGIVVAAGTPALDRARFLTSLSARLRNCLDQGGTWELRLLTGGTEHEGRLDVRLRPFDGGTAQNEPACEPVLSCPLPNPPAPGGRAGRPTSPSRALLSADEDTAAVLRLLDEQERLVQLHREELHQTNQGVLALHSDLEAAALAQRELLEAERSARAEVERARRLLNFLADASAAITSSLSPTEVLRRLTDLLVPEYAARLDVWLFDEEQGDEETGPVQEHSRAAVVAARTGRPQHAAAHPGNLPGTDDLPPAAMSPDRPLLAIPLITHRLLGVLTLIAPGPRFDADTCLMLVELGRRAGVALDNARRYEQHRDTAEALQRAQLTELPDPDGLLLAARYLPATQGMNIGGDWYDAFLQPDGSLLAVIGDVTGHGMHAAVVMGQLRTALRAYAVEDNSPAEILTRLHRMLRHLQPQLYATAMIARFRPGDPEVVWASAGHPPAVVRDADGSVRILDDAPGVMLGIPIAFTYADHVTRLPAGSSLVLYTDGLVERRAHGIDPGIERLRQALAGLSTPELEQDLDAAAEALLKPLMHDSERDDDVCLLLCHTVTYPAS
ncbi:PP2C family protein-serine/threonine phosphatase [Streptomyces griseorubiginosus]|uniref:protein-serine/threonine phosphatase n=1 Tax=Streptomyces griseorubiginosus TaxID=67304 RepID=A0A101RYU0_9ACTN|nr:GAF domain-containing SpoIIE family protein phosphatase [Streptomyces griseorubiginosus]KUN64235.1 phosphatase [Streptomyces griseorubiginosus]